MKEYTVSVPIAGVLTITLKAENDEKAIERAMEAPVRLPPSLPEDLFDENFEQYIDVDIEWDVYKMIAQGNVLYAPINKPAIIGVDEIEEE